MIDSISKIPASPAKPKDSVKAVVDEHGILLGAEVEIDGVGASVQAEQHYSTVDPAKAHPHIIWMDGHSRREIFVDTVNKTSYIRNMQCTTATSEVAQEVVTEIHIVTVRMTASAKAAGGIGSDAQEKAKKEAPPSAAENVVTGGLNVETPIEKVATTADAQVDSAHATPVASALVRSGIFYWASDDTTQPHSAPPPAIGKSEPRNDMYGQMDRWADQPIEEVSENNGKCQVVDGSPVHTLHPTPSPLIAGASYIWVGRQNEESAPPRNENNIPSLVNARIAEARDSKPFGTKTIIEKKNEGTDDHFSHPFAAKADAPQQPVKHSSTPDKSPIVLGEEAVHPVGAPVAPPPAAVTVLAAPKLHVIKDNPLVARSSPSHGSDRESRDHHGQHDGQQNPQEEQPQEQ